MKLERCEQHCQVRSLILRIVPKDAQTFLFTPRLYEDIVTLEKRKLQRSTNNKILHFKQRTFELHIFTIQRCSIIVNEICCNGNDNVNLE